MTSIDTQDKIVLTALDLFLAQGIKKTSVDEVASQAGVSRITAYRYFENKVILVRDAFLQIVKVLEQVRAEIVQMPEENIEIYLDKIEAGFSALPKGDFPSRLDELSCLYPQIYAEFHVARKAVITQIFAQLFATARKQGSLREGLNQDIVQIYFTEAVIGILEKPQLKALNLSAVEVFSTVKSIFLHGILKEH